MGKLIQLFGDGEPPDSPVPPSKPWVWDRSDQLLESANYLVDVQSDLWAAAFRLAGRRPNVEDDINEEGPVARLEDHHDPQVRTLAGLALRARAAMFEMLEAYHRQGDP